MPTASRPRRSPRALDRTASATGELTRDDILDNITLYWLTNTGVSAARLYWENKGGFFNAKGVAIPVAVSVFPGEQYQAPRSWAEQAYPNLIHYNKVDKGGHFAAWEQPQLFSEEAPRGVPVPRWSAGSRLAPPWLQMPSLGGQPGGSTASRSAPPSSRGHVVVNVWTLSA